MYKVADLIELLHRRSSQTFPNIDIAHDDIMNWVRLEKLLEPALTIVQRKKQVVYQA